MIDPHGEYFSLLRVTLESPPSRDLLLLLKKKAQSPPSFPSHPFMSQGWQKLQAFFDQDFHGSDYQAAQKSHHDLLGNPLGPKLEPYASYYSEGTRQGKPLLAIRQFLKQWHLIPEKTIYKDYEDHAVFLLDCTLRITHLCETEGNQWEDALETLIRDHLLPWFPEFLDDLKNADEKEGSGGFYSGIALLGSGIFALEKEVLIDE